MMMIVIIEDDDNYIDNDDQVADKQLRATRQFLEEQAAEREQEREEWDRRLAQVTPVQYSTVKYSAIL